MDLVTAKGQVAWDHLAHRAPSSQLEVAGSPWGHASHKGQEGSPWASEVACWGPSAEVADTREVLHAGGLLDPSTLPGAPRAEDLANRQVGGLFGQGRLVHANH